MSATRTSNWDVMDAVSAALKPIPTKSILRLLPGCTDETVRNWKRKRSAPRAAEMVDLMRHFVEVRRAVRSLSHPIHVPSSPSKGKRHVRKCEAERKVPDLGVSRMARVQL